MKPLFIPLRSEWFDRFRSGEKDTEWRAVGPRWNLETCIVGRPVVLSRGYGKHARLKGTIKSVSVVNRDAAPRAALGIFPSAREFIAIVIHPITRAA